MASTKIFPHKKKHTQDLRHCDCQQFVRKYAEVTLVRRKQQYKYIEFLLESFVYLLLEAELALRFCVAKNKKTY